MPEFQSPLSRGTTPDVVGYAVTFPYYRFQSPLSRGTTPDVRTDMGQHTKVQLFQSPLSRGTTPDSIRFKSLCSNKKKGPKRRPHPHPPPLALSQL